MAKKLYFGVDGVARKVKKAYIGGVKQVKLDEDNYIFNGRLSAHTVGWELTNCTAESMEDDYIRLTPTTTGEDMYMSQTFDEVVTGDENIISRQVLYIRANVRSNVANNNPLTYVYGHANGSTTESYANFTFTSATESDISPTQKVVADGVWHIKSGTVQTHKPSTGGYVNLYKIAIGHMAENATSSAYIDVKEVMVLNLTKIFGYGNEPTRDWCDSFFATYSDVYNLSSDYGSVARRIKKAYVGVNGKARLSFSEDFAFVETKEGVTGYPIEYPAVANAGNYALFAGGYDSENTKYLSDVYAYDDSLSRNANAPSLSQGRSNANAVTVGEYALFAGGQAYSGTSGDSYSSVIDRYDSSLTLYTGSNNTRFQNIDKATVSIGGRAWFIGGNSNTLGSKEHIIVDPSSMSYIEASLPIAQFGKLGYTINGQALAMGDYVLLPNGGYNAMPNNVAVLDSSFTILAWIDYGEYDIIGKGARNNNYAMFLYLVEGSSYDTTYVMAFNKSLTRSTFRFDRSVGKFETHNSLSVGKYAIFGNTRYTATKSSDPFMMKKFWLIDDFLTINNEPSEHVYWSNTPIHAYGLAATGQYLLEMCGTLHTDVNIYILPSDTYE